LVAPTGANRPSLINPNQQERVARFWLLVVGLLTALWAGLFTKSDAKDGYVDGRGNNDS
jgi:hypothetical protein